MKAQDEVIKPYQLLNSIQQELSIPTYLYNQLIRVLQSHKQLRTSYDKSNKMNEFKDEMFQKVVSMFQQKESKTLKKLKTLQEINLKYIQKYLQTKKKSSKPQQSSLLNQSLNLQSSNKNDGNNFDRQVSSSKSNQLSQSQIIREDIKQITQSIQSQQSQSIFQSPQWQDLIRNAQTKISLIQQYDQQQNNASKKDQNKLINSFVTCLNQLLYVKDSNGQISNKYVRKIQTLIQAKKQQISQNKDINKHLSLNNELKRLKDLLQRSLKFENSVQQLTKSIKDNINTNSFVKIFQIITQKVEIQNLLLAENSSNQQRETNGLKTSGQDLTVSNNQPKRFQQNETKNQLFNELCQLIFLNIQTDQNDKIRKKMVQKLSAKKLNISSITKNKLQTLSEYVSNLQQQSKRDKQSLRKLQQENDKIRKQMKTLQNLREKYLYHLESKDLSQFSSFLDEKSELNESRSMTKQRIEKLISKQNEIGRKDELLRLQQQKHNLLRQKVAKIQAKIRSHLSEQGVNLSQNSQQQQFRLQEIFDLYSQSILQNNQKRETNNNNKKDIYPDEQTKTTNEEIIIKLVEDKYSKALQLQRQQFQQRIQQLKSQLRHTQLQRDSYKTSLTQQQKQLTKCKQVNERLVNKKNELQMQSCKTQQMLKSILQLLFGYLMNNIPYESLVEQLQHTIENIKYCLKYREREKDKQTKQQQPIIDYRFSGLSAVSNDYSFSKLNKQSYCDYFNQDSSIQEESQVLSKISEEDELPPSRPSFNHKRTLNDINQRATMAHQDQSLLGYLNPVQVRTPRAEYERTNVLFQGINDDHIRTLQSNLGSLRNRISQHTVQVERQIDPDTKEMYVKYKQALNSLQESQKINKENQIRYQKFLNQLKQQGVLDSNQALERRLYFMQRTIQEQQRMLQQQKLQYETTITQQVLESQKVIEEMLKNMNKSIMSQNNKRSHR